MIRINLLEETRSKVKKRAGGGVSMPAFDAAENVGIVIMFGGIALAAGVMLTWMAVNKAEIASLNGKIAKAEIEKKRLEYVLKRNEELKAAKKELTHRIDIIRTLKENQDRPVRMMLEVSKELSESENVWFEDLTFTGEKLTVRGQALSKFNYSKFLKNLEDSPCFTEVHMGITEERPTLQGTLVSFRMDTEFVADCGAGKPGEGSDAGAARRSGSRSGPAANRGRR